MTQPDPLRTIAAAAREHAGAAADAAKSRSSKPPSRVDRVQLSIHVTMPVRRELRTLAAELDVTLQHLLCQALNNLFEKHGKPRLADEQMLPRGGAAHKANRRQ